MNSLKIIVVCLFAGLLMACARNDEKAVPYKALTANSGFASFYSANIDEVPVDLSKSVVKWRGTKFFGTGSHEGTVTFKTGTLLFSEDRLVGGDFIVDMKSIYNTDIPPSDPVPRKDLTSHLHSDFETGEFPTASFSISRVEAGEAGSLQITGDMKIKGIANTITIDATEIKEREEYTARFTFDRFDWNIGEEGSWLERKVVDAEITLTVVIKCNGGT